MTIRSRQLFLERNQTFKRRVENEKGAPKTCFKRASMPPSFALFAFFRKQIFVGFLQLFPDDWEVSCLGNLIARLENLRVFAVLDEFLDLGGELLVVLLQVGADVVLQSRMVGAM